MTQPLFVIPLWADLLAVGLGGVQGALFASGFVGRQRLDLLGVTLIGILMGMGGGLIRDLLLDVTPTTLQSNWYLLTAVVASLVGMLVLAAGQFIVEHVMVYSVPVSVFVTIGGGIYFLYLILTQK